MMRQGAFFKALKAFNKCVEIDPEKLDAQLKLSEILFEIKSFEKAYEKVGLVLKKEPENINAQLLKAKIIIKDSKENCVDQGEKILQNLIIDENSTC